MKKRTLALILTTMLSLTMISCRALETDDPAAESTSTSSESTQLDRSTEAENAESESSTTESTSSASESTQPDRSTETAISTDVEYIEEQFHDIRFLIPSTWRSVPSDEYEIMYYYLTDESLPMMMLHYTEIEITDLENNLDQVVEGMKGVSDLSGFSSEHSMLHGTAARAVVYTQTIDDGTTIIVSGYIFPAVNGVASLMFGQNTDDVTDYHTLFQTVVDSLNYEVITPTPTATPTPTVTPTLTATPTPTATPEPTPAIARYSSGMYKIGEDMPAGEYILHGEGYFSISSDSTGDFESIIANDNIDHSSIVTVFDGQYLQLSRLSAANIEDDPSIDTTKSGMFKVGLHIPAGEYKLQATGSYGGYCAVLSDSTHSFESIITNENFDGEFYITVSDGQYLQLSRAVIVQ